MARKEIWKAPEGYKEVKSEKRGQFERNEPSKTAQSCYLETIKVRLNQTQRIIQNGIGSSQKER